MRHSVTCKVLGIKGRARRTVSLLLGVALILAVVLPGLAIPRTVAQDGETGDVPMFRGNPARTGEMPGPGPDPDQDIVKLWSFQTGKEIVSSPAVVDGVVYVSSYDGALYAINAASGQQRWIFQTGDPIESSAGGLIASSFAVVGSMVYIGSDDGSLYGIDGASGHQQWAFRTGDSIHSSPIVSDGVVYVGSNDGMFYAIDAVSGQQRWAFRVGSPIQSSPAVSNGVVYIGSGSGAFYAIDAISGQQQWIFQAEDSVFASPTVASGVVYIGSWDGSLYAIDASSGQQLWAFSTGNNIVSSPAVTDGVVYVGTVNGSLYAVDTESAKQRWAFDTGNFISSSPAVADSVVYFGSWGGSLYAIDAASGQQIWAFWTGYGIESSPAVVDGIVYIGSASGELYAIGNPATDMLTATAEVRSAATARAQAATTAEAKPTADASATAVAIEQSWQAYFWTDLQNAFASSLGSLPGMSLATGGDGFATQNIPTGYARMAVYPIGIAGGTAGAWVALPIFRSNDDADAAMTNMSGGLLRSGWQSQKVDVLSHDHACLTLQHADSSEAICYMTRDDALIVSYSSVQVPTPDAALLNAVDLANAMSDAYDQIERPTDLGPMFGDSQ